MLLLQERGKLVNSHLTFDTLNHHVTMCRNSN